MSQKVEVGTVLLVVELCSTVAKLWMWDSTLMEFHRNSPLMMDHMCFSSYMVYEMKERQSSARASKLKHGKQVGYLGL